MKLKASLLFLIFFTLGCQPHSMDPPKLLLGEHSVRGIHSFQDPYDKDCSHFKEKVQVPQSLSHAKFLQKHPFIEYCIPFSRPNFKEQYSLSLNLGYIETYYRVMLNGYIISSTLEEEMLGETLIYDKEVIVPLRSVDIRDINYLFIRVNRFSSHGGGVFSGIPRIDTTANILRIREFVMAYHYGKVIVFYATSCFFLTFYLIRRRNREYVWFALFLLLSALYLTTRLEDRFDWRVDLYIWKKLEYMSLALILPAFSYYLVLILKKKSIPKIFQYFSYVSIVFSLVLFLRKDINDMISFHEKFHLPFMLITAVFQIGYIIKEIFNNNKRAITILLILFLPFLTIIFDILNTQFHIIPFLSNAKISGDMITLLVVSMSIYMILQFRDLENKLYNSLFKEERIRSAFQHYVPPQEIDKILNSFDAEGNMKNIASLEKKIIFFCDIRRFTSISENLSPSEVVDLLNHYFRTFNEIIILNGGVIDKLIGDCIMAYFDRGQELNAVRTALQIQDELKKFNKNRNSIKKPAIESGVGIASGRVVIGNIGSQNKMDYTVIGDAVNLASRIESLTKFYKVKILISEDVAIKIPTSIRLREIDTIRVYGKKETTVLYEPLG
jgi:class 3 adenylate cyclase